MNAAPPFSSRSSTFVSSSTSIWSALIICHTQIHHPQTMLKISSYICLHHYCHILIISSVNSPYCTWRSEYGMPKPMMLLKIYITISGHDHMPTSGRLPTSLGRSITPEHRNSKCALMTMCVQEHQGIAELTRSSGTWRLRGRTAGTQ